MACGGREFGTHSIGSRLNEDSVQEVLERKEDVVPTQIMILGKTGHGKSSFGNTLIGKTIFKTSYGANSQTYLGIYETAERLGLRIKVVDTPGMFDTTKPNDEVGDELIWSCLNVTRGLHAFVFVWKAGERFTEEMKTTTKIYEELFGENIWNYTFLVVTHWDLVKRKAENLENYIESSEDLIQLRQRCRGGYFAVDNEETTQKNDLFVKDFLRCIERNITRMKGNCFSCDMFKMINSTVEFFQQKHHIVPTVGATASMLASSDESTRKKKSAIRRLISNLRNMFLKQLQFPKNKNVTT